MEVHLSPEKEALLSQLALDRGRDADGFAQEILTRYLEEETRFIEAVKKGMAAADRGDFVEHEEVVARIEGLFKP